MAPWTFRSPFRSRRDPIVGTLFLVQVRHGLTPPKLSYVVQTSNRLYASTFAMGASTLPKNPKVSTWVFIKRIEEEDLSGSIESVGEKVVIVQISDSDYNDIIARAIHREKSTEDGT